MKGEKFILTVAGISLTASGLSHAASRTSSAQDDGSISRPNILLILADDLGLGDLSCQYAEDLSTPNIDKIFGTGIVLDNFYANSNVSSPSRAALMTGRFPDMVGVPGVIRTNLEQNWGYLDPSVVTMPQILKSAGYNTALVGKWHLGLESPNLPGEKGFDHFHGFLGDMMDDYYTHRREGHNYMYLDNRQIDPEGHATDLFTRWAVDYIDSQASSGKPFFLYLAYNAPHSPLQPPAEWLEKARSAHPDIPEKRARLIALIEHLDYNIGKVMSALEKSGQKENTLIIFASDNGGDRGSMANNGPVRGYKGDMYEGGIKVPCAVNMPGVFDGGKHCGSFIMLMDILPTLCDLLDISTDNEMDGISVLPALEGKEQATDDRYVFWVRNEGGDRFCGKTQCAARYKTYKFVQNMPFEQAQMFNLEDDPDESEPLELKGDICRNICKALTGHYQQAGAVPFQKR